MFWYLDALKKFFVFSERSSREAFWTFFMINFLISIFLIGLEVLLGLPGILEGGYSLIILLPMIAITVRRLHDTNRSGWWLAIICIPIFGWFLLLFLLLQEGESSQKARGYVFSSSQKRER
ncbi:DUF805 domain-containing protein [Marinomonas sp. 15G1-11]|uniref:DUF805 domain-containing protein n=1 Tax=Marinomonas phaeophyticola TaxID=3004091 RepID=A0ABT4JWU0_9GAMM|nr:DUF805 domain-containing protein [Marinomonas sp. 15G1-11]MCZ2722268.1 DUF805 domain-containing protein [Marinomonas sp. 15G1-11]